MDLRTIGNITSSALAPTGNSAVQPEPAAATIKAVGPVQTVAAVPEPSALPNPSQVKAALKAINDSLREQSQNIEFTVDDDSNRTIVKVVDLQTNEIIRQMPTKEALEIAKMLDRVQSLLFSQKA